MGAGLLPPFIDDDFSSVEELSLISGKEFVEEVQRSEIKSLVHGLVSECQWLPRGAVKLTAGVFIPISDKWAYKQDDILFTSGTGQLLAFLCTTGGGELMLRESCWLFSFVRSDLADSIRPSVATCPETLEASIFTQLLPQPSVQTYIETETLEADKTIPARLREAVPNWTDYNWSCLHAFKATGGDSWRVPSDAKHLVAMFGFSSETPGQPRYVQCGNYCTLDTGAYTLTIRSGDVFHLPNPPKSILCSSQRSYVIAYVYGWSRGASGAAAHQLLSSPRCPLRVFSPSSTQSRQLKRGSPETETALDLAQDSKRRETNSNTPY